MGFLALHRIRKGWKVPHLCLAAPKTTSRVPYRVPCAGCPAERVFSPVHRLFGAKKKPVRCVAGRAFVLSVGAEALSWVMHSGRWASLFQSWQGSCRPCGRHPPRCSSPPRGPQPLPMSGSGQSADGRSDTGVRPESWRKRQRPNLAPVQPVPQGR